MEISDNEIISLIEVIDEISDYDFAEYSEKSFKRRISKILSDYRIDVNTLVKRINKNYSFLEKIVKEITVNTTELFRDPKTWQILRYKVIADYVGRDSLRVWHSGCSTGQEVYSLIILLNEMGMIDIADIYATDLNTDVLKIAQKGKFKYREIEEYFENFDIALNKNPYNDDITNNVKFTKYFEINKTKHLIKSKPFLLNNATFRKHNLISMESIIDDKFDIIFCRNVLIYFNHNLQNRIFEFFYDNLKNGGALVIGRHEGMLGPIANKFKKIDTIYVKR